jgi:hypothetical protein
LANNGVGGSWFDIEIKVLKQKFLFEFWFIFVAIIDWDIMFEAELFERDPSTFVFKIFCVCFFDDNWFLFKHEEQIFHVDSSLIDLSEESTHVEKRSSHLHE